MVKTRGRLRLRKAFEAWPLLVWLGVGGLAWGMHARGTSFQRMNGAVDLNHQYVTPAEDGTLLKILVEPGQRVQAGTVVAEMDSRALQHQLDSVLMGVAATRREEALRLDRVRIDLEAERRKFSVELAEGSGRLGPLKKYLEQSRTGGARPAGSGAVAAALGRSNLFAADAAALESEIGEIGSRIEVLKSNLESVEEELTQVSANIRRIEEDAVKAQRAAQEEASAELLAALSAAERAEVVELKALIAACQLKAAREGVVEKIDRNAGEFVAAGESILQVVAPTGRIVGFLPQAHLGELQEGDAVWITPAFDRNAVYQSRVLNLSARITGLPDASSPLPNQRIYGRHVTVAMPETVEFRSLSPGQTVVIHTRPPGEIPVLNRLFPVDAPPR